LGKKSKSSRHDNIDPWLINTPAQHNHHLRNLLTKTKLARDDYLNDRLGVLERFLPEKVSYLYFF
jgi:hypothetical protein